MPVLTKDQVFEAAMELDDAGRAEVIERLTAQQSPATLSPQQERELHEALREHRENPGSARAWNDIKKELLARL